jgi:hypothetical protein
MYFIQIFSMNRAGTVPTLIKKENQIFLIYQEVQSGGVAKSYMTNGLLIHVYGEIFAL